MIRTAKFENFKGLKDVEVTFDSRFTVLVGPNGTGKTSVLEGIEWIATISVGSVEVAQVVANRTRGTTDRISLLGVDKAGDGYMFEYPVVQKLVRRANGTQTSISRNIHQVNSSGVLRDNLVVTHISPQLGPTQRPQYRSSKIAAPTLTNKTPPDVAADGSGLPALLGYLKLRDDELFDRIEDCFCSILPQVTKLRVDEQSSGGNAAPKSILFDTTFAKRIPASQMSDGTLYILALIVAVLGPHRPKTLLIDDIDMRLHPKAQYELVTLLKKFLDEFPDLQIIATSHSPYILDKLEPNEVRVTGLGDDGSVVIRPITDHPDFDRWKDSMTPGEFWSHTGEEWLKKLKRSTPTP